MMCCRFAGRKEDGINGRKMHKRELTRWSAPCSGLDGGDSRQVVVGCLYGGTLAKFRERARGFVLPHAVSVGASLARSRASPCRRGQSRRQHRPLHQRGCCKHLFKMGARVLEWGEVKPLLTGVYSPPLLHRRREGLPTFGRPRGHALESWALAVQRIHS